MIKLNEMMEFIGYLYVVVCVSEFVASEIVDRLRLNKIRRLTEESKEIMKQFENKWSDCDE